MFPYWPDSTSRVALGALAPLLAAAVLLLFRSVIEPATAALVLMAFVVVAATLGTAAGVAGAVTATFAFDFLFTKPYLSLNVASAEDIETMVVLLVTSVFVGGFATLRFRAVREADRNRSAVEHIGRLAQVESGDVVVAAEAELIDLLSLRSCRFETPADGPSLPRIERNGTISGGERYFNEGHFELPRRGAELPVIVQHREIGRFVLEPTPGVSVSRSQRVVATVIADKVGAALSERGAA